MDLQLLPPKIESIHIYANGVELGVLTQASIHHFQPIQTQQYVSLTMTRANLEGYKSGALHPIFRQNLPEGFNRRYIADRLARYANINDMYLLALQEDNGIGMLTYKSVLQLPKIDAISIDDILSYSSSEPLFPKLLNQYYLRNALSGVQPKVSIPRTDRTLQQKDLIVKSFDEAFDLLTVNEFVCMQAAEYCGLNPPKTYLSENLETFVIERFDKDDNASLGYEDFTTLLKKPNNPDAKYTGSYETLLKATHLYTDDLNEVKKMYKLIVFNCLIGNGDAHLKNFALQYTPDMNKVFVSPPFDITHTIIYDTIDNKMALKLAGSKVFPDKAELIKLAECGEFKMRDAEQIIERLAAGILDYLSKSNEVKLFVGLRQSIELSVSKVMSVNFTQNAFRHDKKRKFT